MKSGQLIWCREALDEIFKMKIYQPYVRIDEKGDGHIQFWGCELVLTKDGQWFMNDTSGG